MGQKTHPVGFRLGIIKTWNSRWFAPNKNIADLIHEDMMVKRYISRRLDNAGISNVFISRAPRKVNVDIHTSRPGIVIGRKGAEVDKLREELQLLTGKDIVLNIVEVRKPELDAKLVADAVARQLVERVAFRRAMKKSLMSSMKMGAQGIKIKCGGRLGGAEIARSETYKQGRIPLHTLRADIDYAQSTAFTTYGTIGVKVWICRGEKLEAGAFEREEKEEVEIQEAAPQRPKRPHRGERKDQARVRGRVRRSPADIGGGDNATPMGRRPEQSARPERPAGGARPDDSRPARPRTRPAGGGDKPETKE